MRGLHRASSPPRKRGAQSARARHGRPRGENGVTHGELAGNAGHCRRRWVGGGGKVTPVRHEHGQQDGSGQQEIGGHLCAPSISERMHIQEGSVH